MKDAFYTVAFLCLTTYICIKGQIIIAPIVFAVILAVMLSPMVKWLERFVKSRAISYILALSSLISTIGLIFYLISQRLFEMFSKLDRTDGFVKRTLNSLDNALLDNPIARSFQFTGFTDQISEYTSELWSGVSSMLSGGSSFLIGTLLCMVITYFLLVYYGYFKEQIYNYSSREDRKTLKKIVEDVPQMLRSYFKGVLIVICILAVANTMLFYAVGLEHAVVWALLVASLAFIPYVGTFIGLLVPLSYSIMVTQHYSQPLAIFIGYGIIQQLEGNILTPKIVGDHVNLNPIIALLFTIVGGLIWGVAGAVIAIPFAGFIRIYCLQDPELELIGKMMGSKNE